MSRPKLLARRLALLTVAICTTACAPTVVSLGPPIETPAWPSSPYPASVKLEPFSEPGDQFAATHGFGAENLAQILRDKRLFARVKYPDTDGAPVDLILRGDLQPRWNARGFANFFTWWPGGLVFAPNWYGTRMRFDAEAKVQLIDASTAATLAEYTASTSHQVVHRSSSPGPFFGALIIIPGVVKGATLTWPRARYKELVHPVAYAELWQQIAAKIVADRGPHYAAEAAARKKRCGGRLDLPPEIGGAWPEFRSCQSGYYELQATALTDQGETLVFVNAQDGSKIRVADDAIVGWERGDPSTKPAVSASPASWTPPPGGGNRLSPPSKSPGVLVTYAVQEVRKAAEDALVVAGFEIQNKDEFYVDGTRPRQVGLVVGSGGERAAIWLEPLEGNQTRVRVRTARTFVGGAGQRNWDEVLLSEIHKSLARLER